MSPGTASTKKDDHLPAQLDENAPADATDDVASSPSPGSLASSSDVPAADGATVGSDTTASGSAAVDSSTPRSVVQNGGQVAVAEKDSPRWPERAITWVRVHLNAVLACLVVLGLAAGLAFSLLALRHEHALDDARASALQAGQDSAVALSSYDYRSLDTDFAAVTDRSTPGFRKSFTQTSDSLKKVLTQYSATAKSTVVAAGVTSSSQQHAVVLVFINQTATNTNQKAGPTTDQSRVQVTLSRSGSRWLIEAVKLL